MGSNFAGPTITPGTPLTPYVTQLVTYVLSLEEYNRYGVQSVYPAFVTAVHTALSVDLTVTLTTKGSSPGQVVTLNELNVSFGSSQRNWYDGTSFSGVLPRGSPF